MPQTRWRTALWLAAILAPLIVSAPVRAQDDGASRFDTLVAPVALFPDPLLAAVLQASVVPLDIVKATRFLDDYAKNPELTPDGRWDPAVRGLLSFPTVLKGMNEHLDWVQTLGEAVVERLPAVQDSIQQVRSELYAGGALKSDDKQTVEVDSEVIRVTPNDPNQIFVPVYDPQTLVAAVEANDAARTKVAAATESGPPPTAESLSPPPPSPAAAALEPPASPASGTSQEAEAPAPPAAEQAPPVPAAPDPGPAPAPAPATVAAAPAAQPVTYAAPVAYPAAPSGTSALWPAVGGFAGGALVGGLLGYAIGDDDDHDYNDGWHSDLDEDDVEDVVDRIDDGRDDARRDRQDYATSSREDRQDFANQGREDRQQARDDAATQRQSARLDGERMRRTRSQSAQSQLAARAQGVGRADTPAASRKAPSPVRVQAVPDRGEVPRFSQAGVSPPRAEAGRTLPRQALAPDAAIAAQRQPPSRRGDGPPSLGARSAFADMDRGTTVKRQELRGVQSRHEAAGSSRARTAAPARAERAVGQRSGPAAVERRSFDAQRRPFAGAGVGGGDRAFAARGLRSRHR